MGANASTAVPLYASGQVLDAARLNLTNAGVPVFSGTATRDAAFGGSGEKVLAEGQLCYLEDTNAVQFYDGAAFQLISKGVLQVVSTIKSDTFTTTSATFVDLTGLSATITPSSTTSKIFVMVTVSGAGTDVATAGETGYVILRDSTQIAVNTSLATDFTGQLSIRSLGPSTAVTLNHATNFLDSPATVSAITYKIQVRTAAGTLYINRDGDNNSGSVSTITLMEISA